jgi:hypothetical protein
MNIRYIASHEWASSLTCHCIGCILWCGYVNCSIYYTKKVVYDWLFVCYSWEMALNVGLDVSFDNMLDCRVMREKADEVNNTKACITSRATRQRSWLRHCATGRKIAGSIPGVIEFFNWCNPSRRIMALGSTQPLTEMSTRNLPAGKGRPAGA